MRSPPSICKDASWSFRVILKVWVGGPWSVPEQVVLPEAFQPSTLPSSGLPGLHTGQGTLRFTEGIECVCCITDSGVVSFNPS